MTNDLISREALQHVFKNECVGECRICGHFTYFKDDSELMTHCRLMDDAPSVDAAPVVHGRWISQDSTYTKYQCSACKERNFDGVGRYCPNCGAKMDAEGEKHD